MALFGKKKLRQVAQGAKMPTSKAAKPKGKVKKMSAAVAKPAKAPKTAKRVPKAAAGMPKGLAAMLAGKKPKKGTPAFPGASATDGTDLGAVAQAPQKGRQ